MNREQINKDRLRNMGLNITNIRHSLCMTQQQLAEKIGMTKDRISEIENGHANITLATLFKMSDALNCRCDISFVVK